MSIIIGCFVVAVLAFLGGLWLAYVETQEMQVKASFSTSVAPVEKSSIPVLEQELYKEPLARGLQRRFSSGQLLELMMELRSLQTQAAEVNERLCLLSTMVEGQLEQIAVSAVGDLEEMAV